MAEGQITEVVSGLAARQVQELIEGLKGVKNEINAINKMPVNLPSDSRNNTNASNGAVDKIIAQRNKAIALIERERLAELKLQSAREKAFDKYEASINKKIANEQKSASASQAASQKEIAANNKSAASAERKAEKARLAELKLDKARRDAFDKFERNAAKEEAAIKRAESAYNRIQASVSILTKTYQDLAIRKQLGSTLSIKEEAQLLSITNRLNMYQTALKKVDADIQKHQRNVGNYASGFNGLAHSINQLSREAPAFANSVQTGFLALSNNIPMLFDEISKIKQVNAELIAQGKPVKSVFSQIGAAVFSLGTALSVGVTLLTIYGDEIVEWATKLFEGSKALNAAKDSQKALADISVEASKSIVQERLELERNLAIARDTTLSLTERKIAAQNVLDQYPYWFENLGQEAILNGNVAEAVRGVTDALLARAKASAAETRITENFAKIIDLELELKETTRGRIADQERLATLLRLQSEGNLKNANSILIVEREIRSGKAEEIRIQEELNALNGINNELTSFAIIQSKEAIGLDADRAKSIDKVVKSKEKEVQGEAYSRDAFERGIRILENRLRLMSKENESYSLLNSQLNIIKAAYEAMYGEQEKSNKELEKTINYGTEDYYKDVIQKLKEEQSALADTSEEYAAYNRYIESQQKLLDGLTGKKEDVKDLHKEVEDFLKATRSASLSGLGFDSLNLFADGTFDRLIENAENAKERFAISFKAITDVAKDTYEFLAQNQQAYFDAQNAQLTRDQKIAESFAHTEEAKQEIAEQYDEKRRELRIAEAKAQKEQAIFNAIINTAQGVTAALAQANIPLSILIGILGAAQVALIAAREIPAFKDGVRNFDGGTALVGDGGRSEIIRTPDGGLFKTPASNTLVNLPKGSDVFKSEGDYLREAMREVPRVAADGRGLTQSEMRAVMQEAFGNVKTVNFAFDKSGFYHSVGTHTARTSSRNNLVQHKGISVG